MEKPFEEALGDLLAQYHKTPIGELISALELQLEALREQEEDQDEDK